MAGFGTQYGVTRYGWEDEGAGGSDIQLLIQPASPNTRLTTDPMVWRLADSVHTANVENLVVGGLSAIVNNVVQPGFTGTCVPNAFGGQDVSIVADADYWEPEYSIDWVLHAEDGATDRYFYGTIVKFVSLPYPSAPAPEPEINLCRAFAFPMRFRDDGNLVLTRDFTAKQDNLRNAVMILQDGIPFLEAGTTAQEEVFESDPSSGPRIGRQAQASLAVLDPDVIIAANPMVIPTDDGFRCRFLFNVPKVDETWQSLDLPTFGAKG